VYVESVYAAFEEGSAAALVVEDLELHQHAVGADRVWGVYGGVEIFEGEGSVGEVEGYRVGGEGAKKSWWSVSGGRGALSRVAAMG
jgi:hypothetical protein